MRSGDFAYELGYDWENLIQIADELAEQVCVIRDLGGVPPTELQAIEVRLLGGCFVGGVDE